MKVQKIDLIGFKSFADRVTLPLHYGITCIVGPNGCGKSNIVDAFRWVLGEQSAKSLRGDKMEEVIFQGSATKKQKGMAEVSLALVFEARRRGGHETGNGGEERQEDALDETLVARRLYRSGESEYLLNKRTCRLRDIRDIFLDTGLDVKSYSILDQGRIADVLNAKPLDRRFLIEEVAGVMKYKVRRAEALSKLETSKQNLQRINDVLAEKKRLMNSLDRQVKKAERYQRLIAQLKEVELRVIRREHDLYTARLSETLSVVAEIEAKVSAKRGELSTIENVIEKKKIEIAEKEKALRETEGILHQRERTAAELEQRMAVLRTVLDTRRAEIVRLTTQLAEMGSRIGEHRVRITALDADETACAEKMEEIATELKDRKDLLGDLEMELADMEADLEAKRKSLFSLSEIMSTNKSELVRLQSSLESLQHREQAARQELAGTASASAALEELVRKTEEELEVMKAQISAVTDRREHIVGAIAVCERELADKKGGLSKEREDHAADLARLRSLGELIVDKSLSEFLTGFEEASRITGTVLSDLISTGSDFERAVEAVLADKINALVAGSREDLDALLRIVRTRNLGRSAILCPPLADQTAESEEGQDLLATPGVRRASDCVSIEASGHDDTFREGLNRVIRRALGDVFVVDDLDKAFELRSDAQWSGSVIVTSGGEVVYPEGFVIAGKGREILKVKREIRQLQRATEEQARRIGGMEQEVDVLVRTLAGLRASLEEIDGKKADGEKKASLLAHTLKGHADEAARMAKKRSFIEAELAAFSQEAESLEALIAAKTVEIGTKERERAAVTAEIEAGQADIAEKKGGFEEYRMHIGDLKAELATYRERIEALRKDRETTESRMSELEGRCRRTSEEVVTAERAVGNAEAEMGQSREALAAIVNEVAHLRREVDAGREEIEAHTASLSADDGTIRRLRAEIDHYGQELSDARTRSVEERLRIENIDSSVYQKYGIAIAEAAVVTDGFDPAEDEENVQRLNGKIRDIGPVNLGTIEEYDQLRADFEFLSKQQSDLTMSIAELEEAISRINTTTRRRLREAHDALRTKFSEVFARLFGGGKADLVLTDEENILESGIEVIAQPPGKKLQNLNLLSGGEKALTSIALLFAGFLIKPSPLCILDEVDAALDESNTERFAAMIKELSRETQFIVITHNRRAMEIADYLYGITMEEAGVSKVISLQFSEAEQMASALNL